MWNCLSISVEMNCNDHLIIFAMMFFLPYTYHLFAIICMTKKRALIVVNLYILLPVGKDLKGRKIKGLTCTTLSFVATPITILFISLLWDLEVIIHKLLLFYDLFGQQSTKLIVYGIWHMLVYFLNRSFNICIFTWKKFLW